MLKIRFVRDTVGFVNGDKKTLDIEFNNDNADLRVIIPTLQAHSFLPVISDNNIRWEVTNARHEMLVEYMPKFRMTVYPGRKGDKEQPKYRRLKEAAMPNFTLYVIHRPHYVDMEKLKMNILDMLSEEELNEMLDLYGDGDDE